MALSPAPYNTPMQKSDGFLTNPWMVWFRSLFAAVKTAFSGVTSVTAAYSMADSEDMIVASGTFILTLKTPGACIPALIANKGAGTVTVHPNASEKIAGGSSLTVSAGQTAFLLSDGTDWYKF